MKYYKLLKPLPDLPKWTIICIDENDEYRTIGGTHYHDEFWGIFYRIFFRSHDNMDFVKEITEKQARKYLY